MVSCGDMMMSLSDMADCPQQVQSPCDVSFFFPRQKRQAYDEKLAKDREREELVEGGPSGGYSKQQVQAPMARVSKQHVV